MLGEGRSDWEKARQVVPSAFMLGRLGRGRNTMALFDLRARASHNDVIVDATPSHDVRGPPTQDPRVATLSNASNRTGPSRPGRLCGRVIAARLPGVLLGAGLGDCLSRARQPHTNEHISIGRAEAASQRARHPAPSQPPQRVPLGFARRGLAIHGWRARLLPQAARVADAAPERQPDNQHEAVQRVRAQVCSGYSSPAPSTPLHRHRTQLDLGSPRCCTPRPGGRCQHLRRPQSRARPHHLIDLGRFMCAATLLGIRREPFLVIGLPALGLMLDIRAGVRSVQMSNMEPGHAQPSVCTS
ncbi:hypothetical protein PSPO01_10356 [Paraphaeosphaeria sporulosa]